MKVIQVMLSVSLLSALAVGCGRQEKSAELPETAPRYELGFHDADQGKVLRIWNLSPESRGVDTCHPYEFRAKIVDRTYREDKTTVSDIVFQNGDGSRYSIGVSYDLSGMARYKAGYISSGMQSLTREGLVVNIQAFSCGNGPVETLDSIEEAK